ncbi:MAG TPA: hypothetical protein VGL40_10410, partial [Bacillota bacterium]
LAGRRAWGPWLGPPLILGGLVLGGAIAAAQQVSAKVFSDPNFLGTSPGGLDATPIVGVLRLIITDIWQTYLVISLVTVALGIAVWIMATRLRPRPAPVGAPPAVSAPPSAPAAPTT